MQSTGQGTAHAAALARDVMRPSVMQDWARQAGIHPNRTLGQNFLIDGNIRAILLEAGDVMADQNILEVGPGLGALTAALLDLPVRLVAIEKDAGLVRWLREQFASVSALELVEGDALDLVPATLEAVCFDRFLSNLPYTPGSRILLDVVTHPAAPPQIAVTVQEEVAHRITAMPGSTSFGLMGLWCQIFYAADLVKRVSPNCFWPRPKVYSAIVRLIRRPTPLLPRDGWPCLRGLSRHLFQHRRKQLGHLLHMMERDHGLTGGAAQDMLPTEWHRCRPEDLPIAVWCQFSEALRTGLGDQVPWSADNAAGDPDGG